MDARRLPDDQIECATALPCGCVIQVPKREIRGGINLVPCARHDGTFDETEARPPGTWPCGHVRLVGALSCAACAWDIEREISDPSTDRVRALVKGWLVAYPSVSVTAPAVAGLLARISALLPSPEPGAKPEPEPPATGADPAPIRPAFAWTGGRLKPCVCGADDWRSLDDSGGFERFECGACGRRIRIELPDG